MFIEGKEDPPKNREDLIDRISAPSPPLGFSISRVSNFAEVPDMVFPSTSIYFLPLLN